MPRGPNDASARAACSPGEDCLNTCQRRTPASAFPAPDGLRLAVVAKHCDQQFNCSRRRLVLQRHRLVPRARLRLPYCFASRGAERRWFAEPVLERREVLAVSNDCVTAARTCVCSSTENSDNESAEKQSTTTAANINVLRQPCTDTCVASHDSHDPFFQNPSVENAQHECLGRVLTRDVCRPQQRACINSRARECVWLQARRRQARACDRVCCLIRNVSG